MIELMTVKEVASYLRVTERTIYRILRRGSIPATKVGCQWRFDRAFIDKWLHRSSVGGKGSILVVDDDEIIRALFTETLGQLGHRVVAVGTGSEGLELLKQRDFGLLFLDLKMPGIDGAELFRQIKTSKPGLPVIIITAYPDSDMMARALAYGPFGIIRKPFNDVDIIMAVNTFFQTGKETGERKRGPVSQL